MPMTMAAPRTKLILRLASTDSVTVISSAGSEPERAAP